MMTLNIIWLIRRVTALKRRQWCAEDDSRLENDFETKKEIGKTISRLNRAKYKSSRQDVGHERMKRTSQPHNYYDITNCNRTVLQQTI